MSCEQGRNKYLAQITEPAHPANLDGLARSQAARMSYVLGGGRLGSSRNAAALLDRVYNVASYGGAKTEPSEADLDKATKLLSSMAQQGLPLPIHTPNPPDGKSPNFAEQVRPLLKDRSRWNTVAGLAAVQSTIHAIHNGLPLPENTQKLIRNYTPGGPDVLKEYPTLPIPSEDDGEFL